MARLIGIDRSPAILEAAQNWVQHCLIEDGSILGGDRVWTTQNLDALHRHFVLQPDAGSGSFYQKLQGQLDGAPQSAAQLMAELLWALFLFPSNITVETKRESLRDVWSWSGAVLDARHPMLADTVLAGIGSGGMGVNTNRWRELNYLIGLFMRFKQLDTSSRRGVSSAYERFIEWIRQVPQDGNRQFRHMLRYLLFPDRVERMSSNGERVRVLAAFNEATPKQMRHWTDPQFDQALWVLRQRLEAEHGTHDLDFYVAPLRTVWQPDDLPVDEGEIVDGVSTENAGVGGVREPRAEYAVVPHNQILFGPPGTGKTYHLQQLLTSTYTEEAATINPAEWRVARIAGQIATMTWWQALGAALYEMGGPATVPQLAKHPYIVALALAKGRTKGVNQTLWGTLQHHALVESATVNIALKLAPYVFEKSEDSLWSLAGPWKDELADVIEIVEEIKQGPLPTGEPVQRYEFVTFHQSFSYEDFMEGLTPVADDESGSIRYEIKKGVFLRLCERARLDPAHAYAMVIDEINRGNVSKVFGELITLIEPDKRAGATNAIALTLPYSGDRFSVPANVHLIGTMNTADRSLAGLDIALRRRFEFVEMPARPVQLTDIDMAGIDFVAMLTVMNRRIEVLLDRDHHLGHAYFMPLLSEPSLPRLAAIFRNQILPLLQEYFFEDWERIGWVLNDQNKVAADQFLVQPQLDANLFRGAEVPVETRLWQVNPSAFDRAESYRGIYAAPTGS